MTGPRSTLARVLALIALIGLLLTQGCSSLQSLVSSKNDAAKGPGAAASAPPAEHAVYRLEVKTPAAPLTKLLENYLDLARFQKLPATDSITVAELDRLVADAPAQARSLLQTEGYFNAQVRIDRNAASPAASPPADAASGNEATSAAAPPIVVTVDPGPRATVSQVDIAATGPLQASAGGGDARAAQALAAMKSGWSLQAGAPFRQADWTTAKDQALAQLRSSGYAAAQWSDTSAKVDATANTVALALKVDSGPLFLLGDLRVEGIHRYDESVVRNLAGFQPGTPYSEKVLLDYQERLQKIGLFGGVVVEIDPDVAHAEATPVTVRVRELELHQTTVGLGYTTNTGERVTLDHLQRNVFGLGWQARNVFSLGHALQSWQGQLTSNPDAKQWRNLIAGNAQRLLTGDETSRTVSARVGRTRESERMDRLYYVEAIRSSILNNLGTIKADAVWGNYRWVYRDLDSVLLPTSGRSLSLETGGGVGRGDDPDTTTGPFGRVQSRLTMYKPFAGDWYAQARIEAGQVVANNSVGIPDSLLFRAGGDDSVRGYSYRSLGPNVNGVIVSGRVMMTSSIEVARPILASLPTLWGAVFVDAGNAAMDWGHLKPALGYGVGLRLRSPVGPLKIDFAYGEQVRQFRLHLSVGVTF